MPSLTTHGKGSQTADGGRSPLAPRRPVEARESGMALAAALLVLLALTMLGLSGVLTSTTDVKISGNERMGLAAQYAAESGLADAVSRMNLESTDALFVGEVGAPTSAWSQTFVSPSAGQTVNGYGISVTATHKVNTAGLCGTSLATDGYDTSSVVRYDQDCGYTNSPMEDNDVAEGFPIEIVTAIATQGSYSSTVILEVTKHVFNFTVNGALNANSNVDVTGNLGVNGVGHDESGNLCSVSGACSCSAGKPAVALDTGKTLTASGSSDLTGEGGVTSDNFANMPKTINEVLGLPASSTFLDDYYLPSASAPSPLAGLTVIDGNYGTSGSNPSAGNITGTGILIAHNPGYDPVTYETCHPDSDPAVSGKPNPNYNPADALCTAGAGLDYTLNPAAHQPANLGNINGGTFKGIVIADKIEKINGNVLIIGAVFSLSTLVIDNSIVGNGTGDIVYSCDAINKYAAGDTNFRLSWHKI